MDWGGFFNEVLNCKCFGLMPTLWFIWAWQVGFNLGIITPPFHFTKGNPMQKLIITAITLCSLVACSADGQGKTQTQQTQVAPSVATEQSQNKAEGVWIDVRSADEYNQGHLTGAVNITHTQISDKIASIAPNKDQPIHLYCRSGSRANVALQELKKLGYTNVTNHGGYDDLVKQGVK